MLFSTLIVAQLFYNWDQLEAVQILENDREISIFYEVSHYQKIPTRPWFYKPREQGLVILKPGSEPRRLLLEPTIEGLTSPEDYAPLGPEDIAKIHSDTPILFGPVHSHAFVFNGLINLRTGPSFGHRLAFYELKEDRFEPVSEETDHTIRRALGLGPGSKEQAPDAQLDRLTEQSGWHSVVSERAEYFGKPIESTCHKVTFVVEDREVHPNRRHPTGRPSILKAIVGCGEDRKEQQLVIVEMNGQTGLRP